jgi:hypothetical protein
MDMKILDNIDPELGGIYCSTDMSVEISAGVTLRDVLLNPDEPLPEYLGAEEISLLYAYLKPEQKLQLEIPIMRLVNSLHAGTRPKHTFTGWKKFYTQAKNPEEKKLSIIQMVRLAQSFMEWYFVYNFCGIEILQNIAVSKMARSAKLDCEIVLVKGLAAERGIALP